MKLFAAFLLCLLLISCSSPAPQAGEGYKHNSTGEEVTVTKVAKVTDIQAFIDQEKFRLSEPGHTPNFEIHTPAGNPEADDECVLYTVVTPNLDQSQPPKYDYFIYTVKAFGRAFAKK